MIAITTFARCILKIIKRTSYVVHDDTYISANIINTARNKTKIANKGMCVSASKSI